MNNQSLLFNFFLLFTFYTLVALAICLFVLIWLSLEVYKLKHKFFNLQQWRPIAMVPMSTVQFNLWYGRRRRQIAGIFIALFIFCKAEHKTCYCQVNMVLYLSNPTTLLEMFFKFLCCVSGSDYFAWTGPEMKLESGSKR